ncbi:MAG: hypothetical protein GVY36_16790 [Verrucomicrobia bacterium]|jgi:hypothetical protein|nr:hypothetical protein [Verrucomicrobiota bacterium]
MAKGIEPHPGKGNPELLRKALRDYISRSSLKMTLPAESRKPSDSPNPRDEQQQLELDRLTEEVEELRKNNTRKKNIHLLRIGGLLALFGLVVAWLMVICLFIVASAISLPDGFPVWLQTPPLSLSEPVLLALIGSTTVNVVSLFLVATRWLYSTPKSNS